MERTGKPQVQTLQINLSFKLINNIYTVSLYTPINNRHK